MTDAPLMTGEAFEGEDDGCEHICPCGQVTDHPGFACADCRSMIDNMLGAPMPRRGWRVSVSVKLDRVAGWLERAARWVRR